MKKILVYYYTKFITYPAVTTMSFKNSFACLEEIGNTKIEVEIAKSTKVVKPTTPKSVPKPIKVSVDTFFKPRYWKTEQEEYTSVLFNLKCQGCEKRYVDKNSTIDEESKKNWEKVRDTAAKSGKRAPPVSYGCCKECLKKHGEESRKYNLAKQAIVERLRSGELTKSQAYEMSVGLDYGDYDEDDILEGGLVYPTNPHLTMYFN